MTETKIEYFLQGEKYGCLCAVSGLQEMVHSVCGGFVVVFFPKMQCAGDGRCSGQHSVRMVLERNSGKPPDNRQAGYVRDGALLTYKKRLCQNTPAEIDEGGLRRREIDRFCADAYKVMVYLIKAKIEFWKHYNIKSINRAALCFDGDLA